MRLLDLFCGAGMAADGYAALGFQPWGVDINEQPNYRYPMLQADVLLVFEEDWLRGMPVVHASPPCQFLTRAKHLRNAQGGSSKYPDLLTPTIAALRAAQVPWVVENVEGAKALMQPREGEYLVRVCGSSFGLEVQRHRLFLSNVKIHGTKCNHDSFPLDPITHKPRPWGVYHVPGDSIPSGGRTARDAEHAAELFMLDRVLPWNSIKEGFPPAYTAYIGSQIMEALR